MNNIIETLEFDKIRSLISDFAASEIGKEKVLSLVPFTDIEKISKHLDITDEALRLYSSYNSVPIYKLKNVSDHLKRSEIGAILNIEELLDIHSLLMNVMRIQLYAKKIELLDIVYFTDFCERMDGLKDLRDEIERCVDESGFVKDSASFELRKIRRDIKSKESTIKRKLDQIVATQSSMMSEPIVTIRNDRFVIPIKEEYKYSFKGIIHDQSSSGQTIYIEPQSTVDLNNQVNELMMKEQAEIARVLMFLSGLVSTHSEVLRQNMYFLGEIDLMFAKGKYAIETNAVRPLINDKDNINLLSARHPLIPADEVVANDIIIGSNYQTMIITGPNTGGKTVTLKTVGLLTLMAQSGIHIPCSKGSEIAVYEHFYADIGDRQSIELNLSTFSSHIVNIIDIVNAVNDKSLVLFDELGSGTDPKEGASLAISILEYTKEFGAKTIATTHYSEMKEYAKKKEYILNASVEFNMDKLVPTYKLMLGAAGHSNALDISRQLGMNDTIIDSARTILESNMTETDKMMEIVEKNMYDVRKKEERLDKLQADYERLFAEVSERDLQLEAIKAEYIKKAKVEANKIVEATQKEVESLLKSVKEAEKGHQVTEAKKSLEHLKHKEMETKKKATKNIELMPGDIVEVLPFEQRAVLSEKLNNKEWEVLLGDMKTKVKISNLIFNSRPKPEKPKKAGQNVNKNVPMKLDLRGMTVVDALRDLDLYMDRVKLCNYPSVTIVHGHGTGAVRKACVDFLKRHGYTFRYGGSGEGGTGATIVEFN
jgi:DNA mismatch repair protein MutS2